MTRLRTATAKIASGQSLSAPVHLGAGRLCGIQMPSAWTAASLTFQVSADGTAWGDLYDGSGNEFALTVVAERVIRLDVLSYSAMRYIKVRSGTAAVPVNQGADRAITLLVEA